MGPFVFYDHGIEALMDGTVDYDDATVVAMLTSAGYSPSVASDSAWADIATHEVEADGYASATFADTTLSRNATTGQISLKASAIAFSSTSPMNAKYVVIGTEAGDLIGYADLDESATAGISATSITLTPPDNEVGTVGRERQPGIFSWSTSSTSVGEDEGSVALTIQRTGGSDGPVSVDVDTSDDTASAGVDYTAVNTVREFADGQMERTVNVTILDNVESDGDRDFQVVLSNPIGGATIGSATATVTITDDDTDNLFADDFESGDFSNWNGFSQTPTLTVSQTNPQAGSNHARATLSDGSLNNNYLEHYFGYHALQQPGGTAVEEAWLHGYLAFNGDVVPGSQSQKAFIVQFEDDDGDRRYQVYGYVAPDGAFKLDHSAFDADGNNGTFNLVTANAASYPAVTADGTYNEFKLRVVCNTPGSSDGTIQFWWNETQIVNQQSYNVRGSSSFTPNLLILSSYTSAQTTGPGSIDYDTWTLAETDPAPYAGSEPGVLFDANFSGSEPQFDFDNVFAEDDLVTINAAPGAGPNGENAGEIVFTQGLDANDGYGQHGWTWGGTAPGYGESRFFRFWMRLADDWRFDGTGSQQFKMLLVGFDSGADSDRIILHLEQPGTVSPCTNLPSGFSAPTYGGLSIKQGITSTCTPAYPVTYATWYAVQLEVQISSSQGVSDGEFRLWINNNDQQNPDRELTGINQDNDGWEFERKLANYWTDENNNRDMGIRFAKVREATQFDPNWYV